MMNAQLCNSNLYDMVQDIGGEEKFGGKTRFYYQNAVAAIVVADASKSKSINVQPLHLDGFHFTASTLTLNPDRKPRRGYEICVPRLLSKDQLAKTSTCPSCCF